ncbi:interaptin-like [Nilaparvata lugens]|uniref:interaptin-like n=1 Tax=Nilaparvata lugens TaxID=108931 RepID=UPI00193C9020|nr:interaptin-like [Nilaparvata lugens]
MSTNIYFSLIFCSCFVIKLCSSESIPALLLKEDVLGKLGAPGDMIGTFINGISKNMNGTVNIPLVVDLMQSESDWMKPTQKKDKSSMNSRISKFKMHSSNQERNEEMTPKTLFDSSLGHKSKSEKDILNELKQSLGIMMKKPSFENRYQQKQSWRTKPVQPKNEKLGEIDVTEANEDSNDENNDEDDSIGNEENSLKDLQTFETPKYTTERFPSTKRRQYTSNRIELREKNVISNGLHDRYYSGQSKSQKLKGQSPFQKKHHETMMSIDDILQVLDKISSDMKHDKNIYDFKENDNNQIRGDGEQQMLLKNLKNYFGLIDLKDKLGFEPVSPGILEEDSFDSLDEEGTVDDCKINYEGDLAKSRPQLEKDDKTSANMETNNLNSFYRNLTDMLMSSQSSGNMNSLINLIRNIDNFQKSSLSLPSIFDSQTNLKSNEDMEDSIGSLSQHLHSSAQSNDKSGFTNDAEMIGELKDNKQSVQNSGTSIRRDVALEENDKPIDDSGKVGMQSVTTGDNSKDEHSGKSKREAEQSPTQNIELSLTNDKSLDANEKAHEKAVIGELNLHE